MPEITLSLPAALGIFALLLVIGAVVVYFVLNTTGMVAKPTPVATVTVTPTVTFTPTETVTPSPYPTFTPLPPVEYTVKELDTCISIAYAFKISVQSLMLANNLSSNCILSKDQVLKVPQPTPTASPMPTGTVNSDMATEAACEKDKHLVAAGETLSSISQAYAVPQQAIKDFNGLASDTVFEGLYLNIPLCKRNPTPGPTPTPTIPPPYQAPVLLLPADGASYTLANDTFTLQWAAVGVLRANEQYQVTIMDATDENQRKMVDYVTDTKYTVPVSFRPNDNVAHVMRWWIVPVRQSGTDNSGNPIWDTAGAASEQRVFSWTGAATAGTTPTP
jgi:LysM repeat protein